MPRLHDGACQPHNGFHRTTTKAFICSKPTTICIVRSVSQPASLILPYHLTSQQRSIYISLMEYRDGLPQSRRHHHIIHCLEALRRDVVCNADDTPRHTSSDPAHAGQTGFGQPRQCRNWDTLNDWAKQHYACFRYDHEELGASYPEIQRFVWCPEGSPYRQEVDKYFIVDYDTPRGHGII